MPESLFSKAVLGAAAAALSGCVLLSSACQRDAAFSEPEPSAAAVSERQESGPGPRLCVSADKPLKYTDIYASQQIKENTPEAPLEWAGEIVSELRESFRKAGMQDPERSYAVTEAEIVRLAPVPAGTAALNHEIVMYRLKWRIYADPPENISLKDGLKIENGVLTDADPEGSDFLILVRFGGDGEEIWERIAHLTSAQIKAKYARPAMSEKYGNPYTAACMEEFARWRAQGGALPVKGAGADF